MYLAHKLEVNFYINRYWEIIRVLLILANLIGIGVLASQTDDKEYNTLDTLNLVFTIVYLIEAIIQIIALGLCYHQNTYLKIPWSYIDVFIIIMGFLVLIPQMRREKIGSILNMVRAIKMTYTTAAMKRLMTSWLHALRKMIETIIVLIFILIIFAVISIGEFNGARYFRCRTTPQPVDGIWEIDETVARLCNAHGNGAYDCPKGSYCGFPKDYDLKVTHQEKYESELVFYGAVGFESFFKAFLACFQIITYDDWAKIMYRMQDSNGSILSRIMYPILVFIGSFFCLNLIVAVIVDTFQTHRAELLEVDEPNLEKDHEKSVIDSKYALKSADQNFSNSKNDEQPSKVEDHTVNLDNSHSKIKAIMNEDISCFKRFCIKIQSNKFYKPTIITLIFLNLIVLCLNRSNVTDVEILISDIFDIIISILFFFEMAIWVGIIGFSQYMSTKRVDLFTNFLGFIEVVMTFTPYSKSNFYYYY